MYVTKTECTCARYGLKRPRSAMYVAIPKWLRRRRPSQSKGKRGRVPSTNAVKGPCSLVKYRVFSWNYVSV
ncbi:hypothetical protein M407DRAFT_198406 [Tulasnella calospora MUT 4182]|uniref:Uncharacterized protein n=1 Tax=Tulasnella calospora MUT 4182 TaxID=1051891 RepID=A0A0C3QWI0_9AGAM|nr:hypothetical protein M407DRAFT_198406 [Tulasnella calospora MUT 4182]